MHILGSKLSGTKTQLFSLAAISSLTLAGCGAGAVHVEPATDAANPNCAKAMVAMPKELAGLEQRETTAQATTAWGDPANIILKCGVEVQEPVSDPCAQVNGVDWIVKPADETDKSETSSTGTWTATTFGRSPNIRITFNADSVSSSSMLAELSSAVNQLDQTKKCTNVADTLDGVDSGTSTSGTNS